MKALDRDRLEIAAFIAEVVGSIAVVITVVYLAVQVAGNTKAVQIQNHVSALQLGQRPLELAIQSADLADIVERGRREPEDLTPAEWVRFANFQLMEFNAWEFYFVAHNAGALAENIWAGADAYYRDLARTTPGAKRYWREYRGIYHDAFQRYADPFFEAPLTPTPDQGSPGL